MRPVNYAVQGESVMIRTRAGGTFDELLGELVASEVDDVDLDYHSGAS